MDGEEEYKIVARLLVEGDIQGVGYRTFVRRVARRIGVRGLVRNLKDGRVEIFCQCKDRHHLDKFIEKIKVRSDPEEFFSPNVERIRRLVGWPEVEKAGGPTEEEFGLFKIDYGEIEKSQQEILTKLDIGSFLVTKTNKSIRRMNDDMTERFDTLDEKYDSFGKKIDSIRSDLKSIAEQFKKLVDHFIKENSII
jgi:acylphosphatase